tara:strand:- start:29 stop:532 length:504 start_codon:yes stop_codon:yes gene_type:complete
MILTKEKAAEILGLAGDISPKETKAAYRKMSLQYHPDICAGGEHMQKMINSAYEILKDFQGSIGSTPNNGELSKVMADALASIVHIEGLELEICGSWLWVSGNTYPNRTALTAAGLRFSGSKKRFYLNPDKKSGGKKKWYGKAWSMERIQNTHGSRKVSNKARASIG